MPTLDQGIFSSGRVCCFLHRLWRRVVPCSCLPGECDWDASRSFDLAVGD